jgi:hypothetical protein
MPVSLLCLNALATLPAVDIDYLLAEWGSFLSAFAAAATTGHTPTELTEALNKIDYTPGGAALATALRRVLAGDRNREQFLAGLDDVATGILTAILAGKVLVADELALTTLTGRSARGR